MTGVFLRELKNRFLCEVNINGVVNECYIASSCHLGNFINLSGQEVVLRKIQSPTARTKYAVCAFMYKGVEIPLEMATSNKVVEAEIHRRLFCFLGKRKVILREHLIDGYKSDLFISDTNTVIEIKSVLTQDSHAIFPTVYSERAIQQLKKLEQLLDKGYGVCYLFVSLNPRVKDICLNVESAEFVQAFQCCVNKGMQYYGFSLSTVQGSSTIKKRIPIIIG